MHLPCQQVANNISIDVLGSFKELPDFVYFYHILWFRKLGPVQSVVSLTNSLKGQLVKCFTTL